MITAGTIEDDRATALRVTPVSHETAVQLGNFVELLLRWQKAVQLVAPSTLSSLWTRHIADSLQLIDLAPGAKTWIDLGSGAGFPGLVIAIALAEQSETRVHLVESDHRKCAFLREAARVTGAKVEVHSERIETFIGRLAGQVEVVTARALAPLPRLLDLAAPLLETGSRGIFLKGQDVDKELTGAAKSWKIRYDLVPSRTDERARIVVVHEAVRRPVTPR
jgi:16S rRNA (guanine527-N7)-methyltransferase